MRNFSNMLLASVVLITFLTVDITVAEVVIENNGYRGLIIAIHESIPENKLLLKTIKQMLTRASSALYNSTKQRAYFEQATIVVPSSWPISPEYKPVSNHNYMDKAEVRIAPPHPSYNNIPYTLQLGECGERGQYIHLTPEFLLEMSPNTGKPRHRRNSKIFLHEWAHLRYGVFNEYGERGNPHSPIFYKDKFDKIRPNGCSANIKGRIRRSDGKTPCIIDINNNLISDCTFYPDLETGIKPGSGKASPMYMPELESADEFCEDDSEESKHNPSAPNKHNRMCNTRSVLDVIFSNADFKENKNPPRDIQNLTTQINIVQLKKSLSPNFVLVLDVSGSMKGKPLENLQNATSRFIKFHIKDACNITLGMVSFASESTILANLTSVGNSNTSREELITKIPTLAEGGTAIGKGILEALQVLGQGGESTEKAKVILLTDGEENATPYVNATYEDIVKAGVVIYTLAIGKKASKSLEQISKMTDGRADFYDDSDEGKSLDSILNAIIIDSGCGDIQPIITTNRAVMLESSKDIEGVFNIDNDVRSTVIFMSYNYPKVSDYRGKPPVASVTDPTGTTYTQESPECIWDKNLRSILFKVPQAQVGKWKYRLENPGNEHVHVNLMITSDTNDKARDKLIRVRSWISDINVQYPQVSKIFAEVKKDYIPVVRALVEATGYRPDGTEETIPLNDNGIGADVYADDGVYTEYFTRYNGSGRYAVDINVANTPYTRLNTKDFSRARAPTLPILSSEVESEEAQGEFSLSDLKRVNEIFETSAIYNAEIDPGLDYESMEPVDDFQRFGTAGTFIIHNWKSKDLIPPSRVTDLTVVATNFNTRTVHLEWTSPGDDMFDGQATSIELRYHHDSVFLVRSFEATLSNFKFVKGDLQPLKAYKIHSVILQLPPEQEFSIVNSSRNIYFAVRALDEERNLAQVSNAAIANFPIQEELKISNYTYVYVVAILGGICFMALAIFLIIKFGVQKRRTANIENKPC